jgi:hypothetical protein
MSDETRLPATIDIAASLEPNRPRTSGGVQLAKSQAAHWPNAARTQSVLMHVAARICSADGSRAVHKR